MLWQAYRWVEETRFGWFGLEDWRLEGVNTTTAIYLGKVQLYDVPLSAPALAAVAFALASALGLIGFTALKLLIRRSQPPNELTGAHVGGS